MPRHPAGMGDAPSAEEYRYAQFRDWGQCDPRQKSVVYDPTCDPMQMSPERRKELDETICRLVSALQRTPLFVKRPATLEPPFFAFPIIKAREIIAAGGATAFTTVLDWPVAARQRVVVTSIGVTVGDPQALDAHELAFRFTLDGAPNANARAIPLFDDQTSDPLILPGPYAGGLPVGETTMIPGSAEAPFSLIEAGVQFVVRGPRTLRFEVRNVNANAIRIKALMTLYQYWEPKADEFEGADWQF